jgi:tetratricopeptide (TPR) repeat protein
MSQKINRVESKKKSSPLKIGNVSVIHGEAKDEKKQAADNFTVLRMRQELNGAKALYLHQLYTNTIVSLHKTLARYTGSEETGEIYFYLGRSFEQLEESGQAVDCYQHAVNIAPTNENPQNCYWLAESNKAINRLKNKR